MATVPATKTEAKKASTIEEILVEAYEKYIQGASNADDARENAIAFVHDEMHKQFTTFKMRKEIVRFANLGITDELRKVGTIAHLNALGPAKKGDNTPRGGHYVGIGSHPPVRVLIQNLVFEGKRIGDFTLGDCDMVIGKNASAARTHSSRVDFFEGVRTKLKRAKAKKDTIASSVMTPKEFELLKKKTGIVL